MFAHSVFAFHSSLHQRYKMAVFISRQVLIRLYGFVLCACRCASSKGVVEDDFCDLSIIYHYLRFESVT